MEAESQQKLHYETGMDLLLQSARLLNAEESEALHQDPINDTLKSFQSLMQKYLESFQDFQLRSNAVHEAGLETTAGDDLSVEERYKKKLAHLKRGLNMDHFVTDVRYKEISQMVEVDSDIVVTKSSQSLVDPITKATIKSPVKNPHCGHVYDRESVTSWIKASKKGQLCPIASCPNKKCIDLNELEEDKVLKRRILALKK